MKRSDLRADATADQTANQTTELFSQHRKRQVSTGENLGFSSGQTNMSSGTVVNFSTTTFCMVSQATAVSVTDPSAA